MTLKNGFERITGGLQSGAYSLGRPILYLAPHLPVLYIEWGPTV